MRVWDIHPGYLNRQGLLGEHRALHRIASTLKQGGEGDASDPETERWMGHGWALRQRHRLLTAEMAFRGWGDRTPLRLRSASAAWPRTFVDHPGRQFALLADEYRDRPGGRIPLPRTSHELWSQHKYSVMARSQIAYREIGRRVSGLRRRDGFDELAVELVSRLRQPPEPGESRNAIQHMLGHFDTERGGNGDCGLGRRALAFLQHRVRCEGEAFLIAQTALSDLAAWPRVID